MSDSTESQTRIVHKDASLFEQLNVSEASRAEALAFQQATSEILQVISGSSTDVQPVFDMIVNPLALLNGRQSCCEYRR